MYTKQERENYNLDRKITCKDLEISENQYNYFRRISQAFHSLFEQDCNGELTEEQSEKAFQDLEYKLNKYMQAQNIGLCYYIQSDPRGCALRLSMDEIEADNYNRSGAHAIY